MKSDLAVFHRGPRQASTQRTWCMQEATKRPTKLGVCRDKLAPPPPPPLASADADPAADAVVVDMKWCGCWVGSVWSRLCWLCVWGGTSSCEKCKQKKIKQTEDKPACCHHDLDNCEIHGKALEAEHLPLSLAFGSRIDVFSHRCRLCLVPFPFFLNNSLRSIPTNRTRKVTLLQRQLHMHS